MVLENFIVDAPIVWDRVGKKIFENPHVKQGRKMRVQITNAGMVEDLSGYALALGWKHTVSGVDGLDVFEDSSEANVGIFEMAYTENLMTNLGNLKASLVLTSVEDMVVAESNDFYVKVDDSPFGADAEQGVGSYTRLAEILLNEESRIAAEVARVSAEETRVTDFNALVDSEIIANNVATKLQAKEAEYLPRLVSNEQQLAETLNKSAITLTHMFADATARDVYFVANPTELMEQLFIKVGIGYQQYLEGAWQASSAIVAEQVSASNQPIIDTGNYFTTDNTNAALQEMGAHKASTSNPHVVTKAQVGLGNVDNTSDANKPVSTAGQTALNLKADKTTTDGINTRLTAEEIATANNKISAVKGKTFVDVDARFEELETINSVIFDSTFNAPFIIGTWTADTGTNALNCSVAHGLVVGDSVSFVADTGTLPNGIVAEPEFYYVSAVPSTTAIQVSLTRNGVAVTIASTGVTGWGIRKANTVVSDVILDFSKYKEVDIYSNLELVPRASDGTSYLRLAIYPSESRLLLNDVSVRGQSQNATLISLIMTKKYIKIPARINIMKIGQSMFKISVDIRGLQSDNSDMSAAVVVNRDFGGIVTNAEITGITFLDSYTGRVKNGTRIVVVRR